jgi:hypothetical protein
LKWYGEKLVDERNRAELVVGAIGASNDGVSHSVLECGRVLRTGAAGLVVNEVEIAGEQAGEEVAGAAVLIAMAAEIDGAVDGDDGGGGAVSVGNGRGGDGAG